MDVDEELNNDGDKTKSNETIKKAGKTANNSTKAFSYVYRLSYTCTLNLFKIIYR